MSGPDRRGATSCATYCGARPLGWGQSDAPQQETLPHVRVGSRVRIGPDEGGDPYRRNDPKPDVNSTDWCISVNRREMAHLSIGFPGAN
jgi:hypothetical protein